MLILQFGKRAEEKRGAAASLFLYVFLSSALLLKLLVEFQDFPIVLSTEEIIVDLPVSLSIQIGAVHGNIAAQDGFLRGNAETITVFGHQQRHAQPFPAEADIARLVVHSLQIFCENPF